MPRRLKGKKKSTKICFRLTSEQKEILELIAEYAGLSLSDLMRHLCFHLIYKFKFGLPLTLPEVVVYDETANVHLPEKSKAKL